MPYKPHHQPSDFLQPPRIEPGLEETLAAQNTADVALANEAESAVAALGRRATAQLATGFPWLRFEPELERNFETDGADRRLSHLVISGIVCLAIYNGFLFVDWLMMPDVFRIAVMLRLGFFTPLGIMLILIGLQVRKLPASSRIRASPATREMIVAGSGLLSAITLVTIIAFSRSPYAQFYHAGLIVIAIYGSVVLRVRFPVAVALAAAIYAVHLISFKFSPIDITLRVPLDLFLLATIVFTLIANYRLERDERTRYLLRCREAALREKVEQANAQLERVSRIDALTGVANRRHFHEYLGQVWARAQKDNDIVSLMMLDVDFFKAYNDRYGHPAGDTCLRQIADALQLNLRGPGDLIARFGGEEFIAVLPETPGDLAARVAERIRKAVEDIALRHEGSQIGRVVTVSFGVAAARAGQPGASPEALIANADAALYLAKSSGRNQVCLSAESSRG